MSEPTRTLDDAFSAVVRLYADGWWMELDNLEDPANAMRWCVTLSRQDRDGRLVVVIRAGESPTATLVEAVRRVEAGEYDDE